MIKTTIRGSLKSLIFTHFVVVFVTGSSVFFLVINFFGCGPHDLSPEELPPKNLNIYFQHAGHDYNILTISTTFSLSCPTVYAGAGTFVQNSLIVSGNSGSIQAIQNTACNLTISSFNDGTSSHTPNPTSLVISISSTGVITSSGTIANPPIYTSSGSTNLYLYLASSTSSSLTFAYTYDPVIEPYTFVPSSDNF